MMWQLKIWDNLKKKMKNYHFSSLAKAIKIKREAKLSYKLSVIFVGT